MMWACCTAPAVAALVMTGVGTASASPTPIFQPPIQQGPPGFWQGGQGGQGQGQGGQGQGGQGQGQGQGGGGFSFAGLFRTHPTLERRLAQLDQLEHELGQAR